MFLSRLEPQAKQKYKKWQKSYLYRTYILIVFICLYTYRTYRTYLLIVPISYLRLLLTITVMLVFVLYKKYSYDFPLKPIFSEFSDSDRNFKLTIFAILNFSALYAVLDEINIRNYATLCKIEIRWVSLSAKFL